MLLKILCDEGEEVEILTPLAYIGEPGEAMPEEQPGESPIAVQKAETAFVTPAAKATEATPSAGRLFVAPAARRIAHEHGLDLCSVVGTGPHGRIVKRDVLAALSDAAPPQMQEALTEDTVIPFSKMRQRVADRLTLSSQTIPHFYLSVDVDMSDAQKWRETFNLDHSVHLSITDLIIKVTATAFSNFPHMNAHVDARSMVLKGHISIGVAVAVDDGLLVPVIADADKRGLLEISELSKKNAEAARQGVIAASGVGTFTISSLGMYGIDSFLPIINPPECAILGVGTIRRRAVSVDDEVGMREVMSLTLGCDHRAVDGTYAAQFLNKIKERLEKISETGEQWAF